MNPIGRLDVNFLSVDRDDLALETTEPIYDLEKGLSLYREYEQFDHCVDDHSRPPRLCLWLYGKGVVKKNY